MKSPLCIGLAMIGLAACGRPTARSNEASQARGESRGAAAQPAPNVPEFSPAFPGQTRAPAVRSRTAIQVTEIAKGFELPWALAFLPDGRMLVTEKHEGKLYVVGQGGEKSKPTEDLPRVDGRDQGGLLDVELGPTYEADHVVYLSYYEPREDGNGLAVVRGRLIEGAANAAPRLQEQQVIFRMLPTLDSGKHAGGRLIFAADGTLFITLGERSILAGRVQARELGSHFGKIVHINADGSIPKDNPFQHRSGALPEIWSLGHRNVLGAAFDASGKLWVAEMGPQGGDELNLVERGKDYGWPTIGYGEEYSGKPIHQRTQAPGLEQPVYYWDPVISPGALAIYSGDLFAEWRGNFLIAGLSSKALIRLVVEGDRVVGEERLLTDRNVRVREVTTGPGGAVFVLTDDGEILRLTPKAPAARAGSTDAH